MRFRPSSFTLLVLAALSGSFAHGADPAAGPAAGGASGPRSAKLDLTPQNFPTLHGVISPHENEWRHLKVNWITDVTAARKKAVAEDKPIVILYTGGAGYNEPLGVC